MRSLLFPATAVLLSCAGTRPLVTAAPGGSTPATATAAASASTAPAQRPDVTLTYEIIFSDRVAGHSVLVRHADGSYDEDYEYTDRGRGPKLHTRTEPGPGSMPSRIEVNGKDYLHRDVHELATCDAQRCKWDNEVEHGEGPHAFYAGLHGGAPDELLLRAARGSASERLPLLPGGALRVRQVAEATVRKAGESRHVVAWEMAGFWLSPGITWFDDDGARFADVYDTGANIREGWAQVAPTLLALEKPLHAARREKITAEVTRRPSRGLAVVHARLFDPNKKAVAPDATILIEGDRVKSVTQGAAAPAGYEVLDATGKTVLPGLWDMHVHESDGDGLLEVAEGITTVRDLGNETKGSLTRRAQWDSGKELGPHLILAGFIDSPGEYQGPFGAFVSTPAEAVAAVDDYAAKGFAQIKMYSSLKPELVGVIAKEAHAKGLRVSGHVPAGMIAEDAVNAGYDELQHINFLVLDLVGDRTTQTQTPLRLSIPAEHAADIDLDAPKTKALLDLLVRKHTVVDPTLVAFEDDFLARPDRPSRLFGSVLSRLPPQVQRGVYVGGLPVPEGKDAVFHESWKRCEQLVKRLWDRHVSIVAGTDNFAGFALHRELELYVEAGIPNADVLAIATLGAARVMKRDQTSGSIAPGKDADLVLIDGDPLTNISDIRNIATVVKSGTVVDTRALESALSIAPR